MYDILSKKAEEFISHEEILATLSYAKENANNAKLIDEIIEKAKKGQGLSHREAAVLLHCNLAEQNQKILNSAKAIKERFYGKRIVMFAPLYLSNYCVNGCTYCSYHHSNKEIPRRKLSQEEIRREVIALQDMGHKRLVLEAGEDPVHNTMEYYLESIKTIYSIKHKNGAIRRVNINIAATSVENYKLLHEAEIGTYILFQETYHKDNYEQLHPTGPKHNYAYHTEAMDRAMQGGLDDVGLGVLFGLNNYAYDFVGLLMHGEHLEAAYGVGPHTISVPRLRPAEGVDANAFDNGIGDDIFEKIVAILRLAVPYTGLIVSTRENKASRERVLDLGISQISGGSKTTVGGYSQSNTSNPTIAGNGEQTPLENITDPSQNTAQFDIDDDRPLDEIVHWLMELGYIPSFCTACYREGRQGDRFMALCKSGQLQNICQPNALMTLQEYMMDYAHPHTRHVAGKVIQQELPKIPNEKVRILVGGHLEKIKTGSRDFRL